MPSLLQSGTRWRISGTSGTTAWTACRCRATSRSRSSKCSATDRKPSRPVCPQVRLKPMRTILSRHSFTASTGKAVYRIFGWQNPTALSVSCLCHVLARKLWNNGTWYVLASPAISHCVLATTVSTDPSCLCLKLVPNCLLVKVLRKRHRHILRILYNIVFALVVSAHVEMFCERG